MVTLLFKHGECGSKEMIGTFTNKNTFRKIASTIIETNLKTDSGNMDYLEEKENIKSVFASFVRQRETTQLNGFNLSYEEVQENKVELKELFQTIGVII